MKARFLLIGLVVLFAAGTLVSSTHAVIDPATIVGIWLFDEGEGDIAADSSGNGNDGTFTGEPEWVEGKFGKALAFGGSSYVDCGHTDTLDLPTGGSVTMCAWVYPDVGSTAAWQGIMAKRDANYSYGINLVTANFQIYTSGGSGIAGFNYSLPVEEWVFICGTMSDDPAELYVDGELFGTSGAGGGVLSSAENLFRIGASFANGEIFNGTVDEVGVFNVVLTEEEIKDIMSKGIGLATGLTAVEPLDKLETTWAAIKNR